MDHTHHYALTTRWEGNLGGSTSGIKQYDRSHRVSIAGKPELHLTTDNRQVGDPAKLNPEDLLVAPISSCHMLSYLYLCAQQGVIVMSYEDQATGSMLEKSSGGGQFESVTLHPRVTVAEAGMIDKALALHHEAHGICYIANSVNFEVNCQPFCELDIKKI